MSMVAHGSDSLAWVCRCSSGVRSASSPAIHIRAGEKVCIHAITPTHAGVALASSAIWWIASELVSTGFHTTRTGTCPASSSSAATACDCSATWRSVSSP